MNPVTSTVRHILLIEDNCGDATLLRLALAQATQTVAITWQTTAEAGLRSLADQAVKFDLILLDLNLPQMSGAEFLAEVLAYPSADLVPIMILSSAPHLRQTKGFGRAPVAYLTKPSDLSGFRALVTQLIDGWNTPAWAALTTSTEAYVRGTSLDAAS